MHTLDRFGSESSPVKSSEIQRIDSLNEMGWSLRYTNMQASRESSEQALNLSKKNHYFRGQAYAILNLAAGHFLRSENKAALELCSDAIGYFNVYPREPGYAATLTYIGNIYESFGDYETARENCQKAYQAALKIGYKEGMGEAQSVLGLIYSRLSDHDSALKAFKEGLKIREELGDQNAVASSLNRIARSYTLKKNYKEALDYYNRSLRIREKLDQQEVIAWTYLGLASTYEEMGVLKEAKAYYNRILETEEGLLDDRCRMQASLGLGRTLFRLNFGQQALDCYEDALQLADKLEAKPLQVEAHHALADYFESNGNFEKALSHFKSYLKIRETVLNDDTRNRLENQQIASAIEKSEKEKEIFQLKNVELKSAYDEIRHKNKEITESIGYASRIQAALLPRNENFAKFFPEHFILFLPRDLVSGDFYWSVDIGQKIVFAAADCTGHGVPGALMSMLGISYLNEIVVDRKLTNPGEILDNLKQEVIKALKQTGSEDEQHDGMDMALCVYDAESGLLEFAGAYFPLYVIRDGNLEVLKGDRMPVCYYHGIEEPFQTKSIQLHKGDQLYLFSDGYVDQVGGPHRKKFKYKPFQELLLQSHHEKMEKQKGLLHDHFFKWKGQIDQYDDVVILGVKI